MNTIENFLLEKARETNYIPPTLKLVEQWIEEYVKPFKTKAEKWDKLSDKIAKCYVDENGDELTEEEAEDIDLGTIEENNIDSIQSVCIHGDFKIINEVFKCTHCGKPYMETSQAE
jgi:hypothetical protein